MTAVEDDSFGGVVAPLTSFGKLPALSDKSKVNIVIIVRDILSEETAGNGNTYREGDCCDEAGQMVDLSVFGSHASDQRLGRGRVITLIYCMMDKERTSLKVNEETICEFGAIHAIPDSLRRLSWS